MKRLLVGLALAALGSMTTAHATTIWTNWYSGATGYPGSALGTLGSNSVTYTGENECLNCFASNWSPSSTWMGGPVTTAPPDNSGIQLFGGNGANAITDTLTFGSPVTNPVLAIVSLGQTGVEASFNFSDPFVLLGGGPSSTWGGSSLTSGGETVYGFEGNGLVMFQGTYSQISWTNPNFENYYSFTVGAVPEVSTWAMMLVGFASLGFAAYRRTWRKDSMAISAA